jgi:hypothetical protein
MEITAQSTQVVVVAGLVQMARQLVVLVALA